MESLLMAAAHAHLRGRLLRVFVSLKGRIAFPNVCMAFGLCAILSRQREGPAFAVRVQCKSPDGTQMLGDVNFTPRDDKTIDFSDLHQTYKATLYKCRD